MPCDFRFPTAAPLACIQSLISEGKAGRFLSYEFRKSALVTAGYINEMFPGDELDGPQVLSATAPLTDEQAIERLEELLPVAGGPEPIFDKAFLKPLLLWLAQKMAEEMLKRAAG